MSSTTEEIQATLAKLVRPGLTPKQLLKETRKAHPDASKREIIRAAFASMIVLAEADPVRAAELHNFALSERSGD